MDSEEVDDSILEVDQRRYGFFRSCLSISSFFVTHFDSFFFTVPSRNVATDCTANSKCPEWLVFTGTSWIFRCRHMLVMAAVVFEEEVGVKNFGESVSADHFVRDMSLMNQFVTSQSIDAGHVSPDEDKKNVATSRLTNVVLKEPMVLFQRQPRWLTVANHKETPNPRQVIKRYKCIQWTHKPFVCLEDGF